MKSAELAMRGSLEGLAKTMGFGLTKELGLSTSFLGGNMGGGFAGGFVSLNNRDGCLDESTGTSGREAIRLTVGGWKS